MCQLDCHWVSRLNTISECVCKDASGKGEHLNWCPQKVGSPLQCRWISSNMLRAGTKQKAGREIHTVFLPHFLKGHVISSSRSLDWSSGLLTRSELHHQLLWVSSWQVADLGSSQSLKHVSQFPHNKSSNILFLWRALIYQHIGQHKSNTFPAYSSFWKILTLVSSLS